MDAMPSLSAQLLVELERFQLHVLGAVEIAPRL